MWLRMNGRLFSQLVLVDIKGSLTKVQFASVINDQLVFLPGENSKTVYGGIVL